MLKTLKRFVDGVSTIWTDILNGLRRAARTIVGVDGNPNRYDGSICWYVIHFRWLNEINVLSYWVGLF